MTEPAGAPAPEHPDRLMDDYLVIARRRPGALPTTALRTRSLAARALLGHAVAGPLLSPQRLIDAARTRSYEQLPRERMDVHALADLARIVALQEIDPTDAADGMALYDLALDLFGPECLPKIHQCLHTELAYRSGRPQRAAELLHRYPDLPARTRAYLRTDLSNPFVEPGGENTAAWLESLGALVAEPGPTLLRRDDLLPFDRLTSRDRAVPAAELISVVVTCYRPDLKLLTAVRSLLEQSWRDLEIIIVDDGSPRDHEIVLKECLALDERVRLLKLPRNAGTYAARNAGMDAASGRILTFQDSDDWSHPRRLERQAEPLLRDPSVVASVTDGLRVSDHLVLTRQPGRDPRITNTSSLMVRKDVVQKRLGYFDSVRRAADSEYLYRIEAAFGVAAVSRVTDGVYALIRLTADSVSRSDFRTGWMHPARLAYKSAYELWHRQIAQEGVTCHLPNNPPRRPFAAPAHVRGVAGPVPRPRYDVVFAGEWRRFGGPQKSMLEEVRALVRHGKRVAVMQMEAFRFMSKRREQLCRPVQELINAGTVDLIVPSDEVDAKLLIIRYPPVLQFAATEPSRLRAERVIILANQAPSERDGSDWRYVPKTCSRVAQEIFAVQPAWCPQGPAVRQAIAGELGAAELLPFDMPGIIDVDEWTVDRTRPRADRPVMGKHSRDNWTKWPADRDTLLRVYPDSADVDVRFMGGTRALRQVLEGDELPIGWLAYDYDEVSVRSFLCQLDFYVYFPHPTMVEAFGRAILEALACGCVVILPEQFTETFGDAAVYCTPEEVWPVVQRYYADRAMYLAQSRLAVRRVRELFGPEGYVRLVDGMITQPTAGGASLVDVGRATGVSCAAVEENDSGTEHG